MRPSLKTAATVFGVLGIASVMTAACGGASGLRSTGTGGAADDQADGGGDDGGALGACGSGTLSFDLSVDASGPVYFGGGQPPWPTQSTCPGWLTITDSTGQPLLVWKGACFPLCPASMPRAPTAQSYTWDGTYYPVPTNCSGGPECTCTTPACASPGTYVATFCVGYAPEDGGFSQDIPTCKQVSFTWPPTSGSNVISETITPTPDGG